MQTVEEAGTYNVHLNKNNYWPKQNIKNRKFPAFVIQLGCGERCVIVIFLKVMVDVGISIMFEIVRQLPYNSFNLKLLMDGIITKVCFILIKKADYPPRVPTAVSDPLPQEKCFPGDRICSKGRNGLLKFLNFFAEFG